MDVARDVIELFSVKDPVRARELAAKLDQLNTDRQEEERRILRAVEERFAGDPALCDAYCIVVDGEGWHRGVIGITATRVVERYNRPDGGDFARRRRGFRLRALDSRVPSAGGNRVLRRSFLPLRRPLPCLRIRHAVGERRRFARASSMPSPAPVSRLADFDPVLDLDAELDLTEVTPELFQALQLLEPYGMGNPEPVFAARGVQLTAPPRILKDKHVKLKLRPA